MGANRMPMVCNAHAMRGRSRRVVLHYSDAHEVDPKDSGRQLLDCCLGFCLWHVKVKLRHDEVRLRLAIVTFSAIGVATVWVASLCAAWCQ
jgi:hypothetical protein